MSSQNIVAKDEWSVSRFFPCRTLVQEKMPYAAQTADRQNGLRLLRGYLLFPSLIWTVAGIGWGVKFALDGAIVWGVTLLVIDIILSFRMLNAMTIRTYNSRS